MSDSSIRTKPSIDEPSNMIWPSSASLELPVRHLDVLDDAENVGELQAKELHALLSARSRISLQVGHAPILGSKVPRFQGSRFQGSRGPRETFHRSRS